MPDQAQSETPPTATKKKNSLECALEAAVNAFVIVLLGKIAVGLVGGILSQMIPSLPPGLGSPPAPGGEAGVWWSALGLMRYKFLYAIAFVICFRLELAQRDAPSGAPSKTRWERIGQRLWEKWFGSLVGNAFLAMILAPILAMIPDISLWKWFWNWLQPVRWLGADFLNAISPWLDWYGQNRVRFNFWVLYLAAVSDDFGIPNFKSLTRWMWRRWRGKFAKKADRIRPSNRRTDQPLNEAK